VGNPECTHAGWPECEERGCGVVGQGTCMSVATAVCLGTTAIECSFLPGCELSGAGCVGTHYSCQQLAWNGCGHGCTSGTSSCSGRHEACEYHYEESTCLTHACQPWYACTGTHPCDDMPAGECEQHDGCSWEGERCTGVAKDCASHGGTADECKNAGCEVTFERCTTPTNYSHICADDVLEWLCREVGCTWTSSCTGTPHRCEDLLRPDCNVLHGSCSWSDGHCTPQVTDCGSLTSQEICDEKAICRWMEGRSCVPPDTCAGRQVDWCNGACTWSCNG
jgi:hypothetical protein